MDQLLNQIDRLQDVLLDYQIKDALVHGSRVFGAHKPYSDLDVVVNSEHLNVLISEETDDRRIIPAIFDEISRNLCSELKIDVNIQTLNTTVEYMENQSDIQLPILTNGEKLAKTEILSKLNGIQTKGYFPPTYNRIEENFSILFHMRELGYTARFYPYIKTFNIFKNPKTMALKTMSNHIINAISQFSYLVEKIEIDSEKLKQINRIVRDKQLKMGNFNSADIGWIVCTRNELTNEELQLYWDIYMNMKEESINYVNKVKEIFPEVHYTYELAINDEEGLIKSCKAEYKSYTKPKRLFKPLINHLVLMDSVYNVINQ